MGFNRKKQLADPFSHVNSYEELPYVGVTVEGGWRRREAGGGRAGELHISPCLLHPELLQAGGLTSLPLAVRERSEY